MMVFDLSPRAPLHVGEAVGIERESVQAHIPSDTLFAAIVSAWVRLTEDVDARVDACRAGPETLRLTSAFPRAGDVRFYPHPLGLRWRGLEESNPPNLDEKQRKRVQWVSRGIFEMLIRGADVSSEWRPEHLLQGGGVWVSAAEAQRARDAAGRDGSLWRRTIVPRVVVGRSDNRGNLFHSGRLTFGPECGLWLMAQGSHVDWVNEALRLLQEAGIGGLRASGHGAFALSTHTEPDLPIPARGHGICLSRYAPGPADPVEDQPPPAANVAEIEAALQSAHAAYALVHVGGWCQDRAGKAWRRRAVRLVAEGACLGAAARGRIVDVTPQVMRAMQPPQLVYRYGYAFLAPAQDAALEQPLAAMEVAA